MTRKSRVTFATVGLLVVVGLISGPLHAEPKDSGIPTSSGGVCHVVDGANKGKTGTYDEDGDCCNDVPGGWGCTSCGGSNTGKCADGPAPKTKGGVVAPNKAPAQGVKK